MKRLLIATWEGGGTVPPVVGLARRLLARGVHVTLLADPTLREEACALGCDFVSWSRAPHRTTLGVEQDVMRDWEVKSPLTMLSRACDRMLVGPAAAYAEDTREAIARAQPDAVVADYVLLGALMAAELEGLPRAALVPNIWPIPVAGVPPFGPGFGLATHAGGRLRDWAFTSLVKHLFDRALPRLNGVRAGFGLEPLRSLFDQILLSDAVYVLSSPSFDFSAPYLPPHVQYLGPVLDDPGWVQSPDLPWAEDDERPLVLVGFSSTFQDQAAVLGRVVDALAELPVRGVVTLGATLDAAAVRSRGDVHVVRSAPHAQLLPKASLVITHAGHGTTLKALAAGVPLLCLPMGRDQPDTAARVTHHGLGRRLSPGASVASIRREVSRLLQDTGTRDRVSRFARVLADERERVDPVSQILTLARDPAGEAPSPCAAGADRPA